MIKRFFSNAIVKNAGWIIFGRVVQMILSLAVGILTARYLGPSNYGIINYASSYAAFFMAFCTLGINSVLVKELIEHAEEDGVILGTSLALRAVSSILSAGVIIFIVAIWDKNDPTVIWVTAIYSLGIPFHIFELLNYWFQSKLKSKITAVVTLLAYAIMSVYKIILLICGKTVEWFAFSNVLEYICIALFLLICYRKFGGKRFRISKSIGKRILSQSVHFILPSLMVSIYGYVDKIMLKHMLTETSVGHYATATAICGMWCFVLTAIIDSVYPSIMETYKKDTVLFEKINRRLYAIIFYIAVIVSLLFCVLGEWIILLLYGETYRPAVSPLRIITWYTSFSYLGVARNAWIVCEKKQKHLKYIYVSAAIINVLLNLVFIPISGASGAAVASLVTQITTTIIIPFFIKDLRRNSILMLEGIFLRNLR